MRERFISVLFIMMFGLFGFVGCYDYSVLGKQNAAPAPSPSCSDKVKNGSETDIDCGDGCGATCQIGQGCLHGSDCQSGVCTNQKCVAAAAGQPTCNDKVKNGNETDIDCGGSACAACVVDKACATASDCMSGNCASGVCRAAATCVDGVKNMTETDVDCGGGICSPCGNGKACVGGRDCGSGVCMMNVCAALVVDMGSAPADIVSVTDIAMNQDLIQNDFASSDLVVVNDLAPAADVGITDMMIPSDMSVPTDQAQSDMAPPPDQQPVPDMVVVSDMVTPTCNNGLKDGNETDLDCGGSCTPCAVGRSCNAAPDCVTGTCAGNICSSAMQFFMTLVASPALKMSNAQGGWEVFNEIGRSEFGGVGMADFMATFANQFSLSGQPGRGTTIIFIPVQVAGQGVPEMDWTAFQGKPCTAAGLASCTMRPGAGNGPPTDCTIKCTVFFDGHSWKGFVIY